MFHPVSGGCARLWSSAPLDARLTPVSGCDMSERGWHNVSPFDNSRVRTEEARQANQATSGNGPEASVRCDAAIRLESDDKRKGPERAQFRISGAQFRRGRAESIRKISRIIEGYPKVRRRTRCYGWPCSRPAPRPLENKGRAPPPVRISSGRGDHECTHFRSVGFVAPGLHGALLASLCEGPLLVSTGVLLGPWLRTRQQCGAACSDRQWLAAADRHVPVRDRDHPPWFPATGIERWSHACLHINRSCLRHPPDLLLHATHDVGRFGLQARSRARSLPICPLRYLASGTIGRRVREPQLSGPAATSTRSRATIFHPRNSGLTCCSIDRNSNTRTISMSRSN